jgi:hypothetical protein
VPELPATWATAHERQELDGEAPTTETFRSLPARSKAAVLGFVSAVLAGSIGWVLIAERWAFSHVQARAASGKRLPHTGPALRYGTLSSGLWLLPTPSDTH